MNKLIVRHQNIEIDKSGKGEKNYSGNRTKRWKDLDMNKRDRIRNRYVCNRNS